MSPKETRAMSWEDLPDLFPGFPDARRWLPALRGHLEMVEAAASHTRVTSVTPTEAIRRHYAESLEILRVALAAGSSLELVVDVGSGGGYPGLVFACVFPGARVELVEPLQKRARLLVAMAEALGLGTVRVHPQRGEEAGRGLLRDAASLVTARAVSPLAELLEYTAPLTATGGLIVLPKGTALDEELAAAEPAFSALSVELAATVAVRPEIAANMRVLIARKTAATDQRYPRRAGMAGKRPLQKR